MQADLDAEDGPLGHARFAITLASRAVGLEAPIDSAFIDINAPERLKQSAADARRMGYQGKCCIHPAQLPIAHSIFAVTDDDYARAMKIVASFERPETEGKAAIMVDGRMADYPVAARVRQLLAARHRNAKD